MKRLFILISNVLTSLFLVWVFTVWSDTFVSNYYPSVVVFDASPDIPFDQVEASLTRLADETDSLIGMQHQEIGPDGDSLVTYTLFGEGQLPAGLTEKTLDDTSNVSFERNYFIFKGNLTVERLKEELGQLGMSMMSELKPSFLSVFISLFGNGFQLIGLLIFILTFGSLTLISQIKTLRTAGIRLISGENRWKIFLSPLNEELLYGALCMVLALVIALILGQIYSLSPIALYMIGIGLFAYNVLLLLISLFFASLFATSIKKVHLMQVIKGQMPVKGILSLILIGQLLAVIIVSFGINQAFVYSVAWMQQEQGSAIWSQDKDLVSLSVGREGLDIGQTDTALAKSKVWFTVMDQAVADYGAILSRHFLVESELQQMGKPSFSTSTATSLDYSTKGNVLIVTPSYLEHQKVQVTPEISEKIEQLTTGEFILLLPETLQSQEEQFKTSFEEEIANLSLSESPPKMSATVSYLETGQKRFVYNTTPFSYQHFLIDPIIVVLTPQSTGEQYLEFWEMALQGYFLFNNLEDTQELLKLHQIENWAGDLRTGYHIHQTLLHNIQREVYSMIAGAILGITTSILLFNTMNLLYFEEFRRDIFIKRVAGLRFFELHQNYLLAQFLIFLLGFLTSLFFTQNLLICLLVFSLFLGNSIFLLNGQMKKENKMSTLVLKGA